MIKLTNDEWKAIHKILRHGGGCTEIGWQTAESLKSRGWVLLKGEIWKVDNNTGKEVLTGHWAKFSAAFYDTLD